MVDTWAHVGFHNFALPWVKLWSGNFRLGFRRGEHEQEVGLWDYLKRTEVGCSYPDSGRLQLLHGRKCNTPEKCEALTPHPEIP